MRRARARLIILTMRSHSSSAPTTALANPFRATPDPARPRGALFSPVAEAINLGLPFAFAVAVLAAKLVHYEPGPIDNILLGKVTAYFFLNTTHVVFTFLMFLFLPEARTLLVGAVRRRARWPFVAAAFVLALMAFGYQRDANVFALDAFWSRVVFALLLGISYQHILAQMFGFSMLYNTVSRNELGPEPEKVARLQGYERRCFQVLLWLVPTLNPFVQTWQNPIAHLLFPLEGALATGIVWNAWHLHKLRPSKKFIYLCRLPFWLFAGPYIFGDLIIRSLHGIEYLFITRQMLGASSKKRGPAFMTAFWFGSCVIYPMLFYSLIGSRGWLPHMGFWSFTPVLFAIVPFLEYVHYYLDGIIFRFKDFEVRRLIGPLLVPRA